MNIQTKIENLPQVAISKKVINANSIIPRNIQWALYIISLVISDAVMTYLALRLAFYFRFDLFVQYFDPDASISFDSYRLLIYWIPFLWLLIFAVHGLYTKNILLGGTHEYSKVFSSASTGFLIIVIAGFLEPAFIIARGWLVITYASTFLFVAGSPLHH